MSFAQTEHNIRLSPEIYNRNVELCLHILPVLRQHHLQNFKVEKSMKTDFDSEQHTSNQNKLHKHTRSVTVL